MKLKAMNRSTKASVGGRGGLRLINSAFFDCVSID